MKLSTLSPLALAVGTALLLAACGEQATKPAEAPAASGAAAAPAAGGEVQVSVNDKVCEPMELTVPAGKTTFVIKNNSMKALEWEILKGVMIVDERENIAPSLTQKLTVTLQPGEYEITCGLLSNPRGKLIVTENAGFKADAKTTEIAALAEPLGAYKSYVQEEMKQFVAKTEAFTAAVKSGDAEKAKSLYADTRTHYERIEPIAELFAELDSSIDARADAFETLEKDPNFTGFHRLEYALWSQKNIKDMGATADKLLADVKLLQTEIDNLGFPPSKVVGGAAALVEEVAAGKITGEEERYSHTDLSDFYANMEGSKKIVDLFRPQIEAKNPDLLKKVDAEFKAVDDILIKYKQGNGFKTYDALSDADRTALKAPVQTLAEELAKLRGTLGLD